MDFNATSKRPMNLAMFLFAVEHVSAEISDPSTSDLPRIHPPRICPGSIHHVFLLHYIHLAVSEVHPS